MKPAASIIIFTVLSGFGFGLFFWLGLTARTQDLNIQIITFTLAFLLSTIGLVASSFHLGNPQRALRAFTQWRSSWLSREAILAVLTLIFYLLHAVLILFFNLNLSWLGIVCAVFSLLTIFSTAMIYTQMKTVPRWNMSIIPPLFLLYGATGSSVIVESFFLCSFKKQL